MDNTDTENRQSDQLVREELKKFKQSVKGRIASGELFMEKGGFDGTFEHGYLKGYPLVKRT